MFGSPLFHRYPPGTKFVQFFKHLCPLGAWNLVEETVPIQKELGSNLYIITFYLGDLEQVSLYLWALFTSPVKGT
jgi:hypothetical protein